MSTAPRNVLAALALATSVVASAWSEPAPSAPSEDLGVYPPWQHGANDDVATRGLEFTVPEADVLADFHGDPQQPKLVLFVGGNYFFAMAPLVRAFETGHPEFRGRVYWETIPPGLLVRQIKAGGRITVGNMSWTVAADVYLAGLRSVREQIAAGLLAEPAVPYVTNTLAIMVPKGNPAHVTGLADLARADVRLAMPNPQFEGIARQIRAALVKTGGESLANAVYEGKVSAGGTRLTRIHHRQTPLWLMLGRVDAGVTWQSEALFQEEAGHPIEHVDIPAAQNTTAVYAGAVLKDAPHPEAGREWLDFLRTPEALAIFARYGFKPYVASPSPAGD